MAILKSFSRDKHLIAISNFRNMQESCKTCLKMSPGRWGPYGKKRTGCARRPEKRCAVAELSAFREAAAAGCCEKQADLKARHVNLSRGSLIVTPISTQAWRPYSCTGTQEGAGGHVLPLPPPAPPPQRYFSKAADGPLPSLPTCPHSWHGGKKWAKQLAENSQAFSNPPPFT